MSRPFYQATAEQVVLVSEAVVSLDGASSAAVSTFTELLEVTAKSALQLAADMGLLTEDSEIFKAASPLCRLLRTPQDREKAAILRIALESYEPFQIFREEHYATGNVTEAAQRTKAKLNISSHREEVKATLLSLATYCGALTPVEGNTYTGVPQSLSSLLDELVQGSREVADATQTIWNDLGPNAALVNHELVIQPLVAALRHALAGSARESVLQAGIAIENFLTAVALEKGVDLDNSNGVNAKMQGLYDAGQYPKKILNMSKYIGHIRNAADHGSDADIGAPWEISNQTGRNYIFVAVSLVRAMLAHSSGQHVL